MAQASHGDETDPDIMASDSHAESDAEDGHLLGFGDATTPLYWDHDGDGAEDPDFVDEESDGEYEPEEGLEEDDDDDDFFGKESSLRAWLLIERFANTSQMPTTAEKTKRRYPNRRLHSE
jgi:hypothetical protein